MAAPASEWAFGYLDQARADLRAAAHLQGEEPSVGAMLCQMGLEKLGKAALLKSGAMRIEAATSTHRAAAAMVQQIARNRRTCALLGWQPQHIRTNVLPHVELLERCQPSLAAGGACLEYPWEHDGVVLWPRRDLQAARLFSPHTNAGQLVVRFADAVQGAFERIYA